MGWIRVDANTESIRTKICEILDETVEVLRTLHQMGSSYQVLFKSGKFSRVDQHLCSRSETMAKLVKIDRTLHRILRRANGKESSISAIALESKLAKVQKFMESVRESDRVNQLLVEDVLRNSENYHKRRRDRSIMKRSAYCVLRKGRRRSY
jgi:hypothetical protein